jgi:hypothetical protein
MFNVNAPPVACRPSALTLEECRRSQALRGELAAATKETIALPDGYAFQLHPDPAIFVKAAEWVSLERRCCPFLAFELSWPMGDETPPRLSVTGPDGTKAFLAAEMPKLSGAE